MNSVSRKSIIKSTILLTIVLAGGFFFFPSIVNAQSSTTVGALSLVPAFENIGVYSNFTGDDNNNSLAVLEYREVGIATWKPGIPMTVDRRDINLTFRDGSIRPNPYKNQWRAVIFWLKPNIDYEVKVNYTDPDGVVGTNPVTATIRTRNDNPLSSGNTYYVSTTGNDINDGLTEATAFRTIQKAANTILAGDKVLIMPGVYNEEVTIRRSGIENNYITFQSYDLNNKAVIDGQSTRLHNIHIDGADYIRIRGLDLRNVTPDQGLRGVNLRLSNGANNNIIEDNVITGPGSRWASAGVLISDSDNATIQRNQISLGRPNPIWYEMAGIMFWNTNGGHVVKGNTITGAFYDGISGSCNECVDAGVTQNTYIYNNYVDGPIDDGMEVEGGNINVGIWNNTIKNNSRSNLGIAPVLVGPIYVFRNLLVETWYSVAIKMGWSAFGNTHIYHNTIYGTEGDNGPGTYGSNAIVYNAVFRNNIIYVPNYDVEETLGGTGEMDFDYNCMYSVRVDPIKWLNVRMSWADWRTNYGKETNGVWGQPEFIDPINNNFQLRSTSPCIDKGVILPSFNDANSPWPYKGTTPDLGAYEFDSGAPVDITPPVRSDGQPTGTLAAGTTQTNISLATDENATCRYSTATGTFYASMVSTFSTTGGTSHSTTVTGLSDGNPYNYYVRCQDTALNANTSDILITFFVTYFGDISSPSPGVRDGKVDIYDASRLLSKWGSTLVADLAEADINPGPGNVSLGKIDLYDANKMMANWTP